MISRVIQVFEHEKLRIGEKRGTTVFTRKHHEAFIQLSKKNNKPFFSIIHNGVQFSSFVGAICLPGLTVEILPKADRERQENYQLWQHVLIDMLRSCRFLKVNSESVSRLKGKPGILLDLYISSFLDETEKLIREGIIKQYQKKEGFRTSVQGRILFTADLRQMQVHKEKTYCRYQSYDFNHRFNKILVKALKVSGHYALDFRLKDKAFYLLSMFNEIEEVKIGPALFANLQYNRQTQRYKTATELAAILLVNPSFGIEHGSQPAITLLFDMNKLFEEFVFRQLKRLEERKNIRVSWQTPANFWENRKIRPDILISYDNGRQKCVIDTKWKILRSVDPSMDDLRQMYVYNQYFGTSKGLLLYPQVYPLSPLAASYQPPINSQANSKNYCQINFVQIIDQEAQTINQKIGEEILSMISSF